MKDSDTAARELDRLVIMAASVADFGAVLLLFSMTAQPVGRTLACSAASSC